MARPYIVLDACIAGAWAFVEPFSTQAVSILDAVEEYRVYPIVPDRFQIELLRVCQKKTQITDGFAVSYNDAWQRFQDILSLPILFVPSDVLYPQAWHLASAAQLTVHDALYLALAIEWDAELWTLDDRLANTPNTVYSKVYDLRSIMFPY